MYLDDILIYSESEVKHQKHVRQILNRLRESSLFIKLEKCAFHVKEVKYLSYIISSQRLSMNLTWVVTVQKWLTPHSVKDVQSFLSFCNFYQWFIKGYSDVAHALTELMKKTTPFQWGEETEGSFQRLKQAFQITPLLAQFNPEGPIFMEMNASDYTVRGILSQWGPDMHRHSVAFFSRKLQPAERNYGTPDQELLTIVTCFKAWWHYLKGSQHPIQVITDHHNLQYFLGSKPLTQRQAHWAEFLSGFNFSIEYWAGFRNLTDAPSWRSDYHLISLNMYTMMLFFKLTVLSLCVTEAGEEENSDGEFLLSHTIIKDIQVSLLQCEFSEPDTAKHEMRWQNGLLYLREQIYVPDDSALKLHILHAFHDSQTADHLGRDKTLTSIRQWFYWPDMTSLIMQYVKSCDLCDRTKSVKHLPYRELQPLPASDWLWTHIMINFITDLLKSHDTIDSWLYDSILIMVNHFSKMSHYIPMRKDLNSLQFTWLLLCEVIWLHHVPEVIISDHDTLFQSDFWVTLLRLLETDHKLFTAFHPQTDGQTEHQNQTLEHYLRCFVNYLQDDWVTHLSLTEHTYNVTQHSITKVSSFFTCTDWDPVPFQLHPLWLHKTNLTATEMAKKICHLQEQLVSWISEAQDWQAKYYDKEHKWQTFKKEAKVWLKGNHLRTDRLSKKLNHRHLSPFIIRKKIEEQAYHLDLPNIMKVHSVFHVSLLKLYLVNEILNQVQPPSSPVMIVREEGKSEEYEVKAILRIRLFYRKLQYLIRWKGYEESESVQWCSSDNVMNAAELMKQFHWDHLNMPWQGTRKKRTWTSVIQACTSAVAVKRNESVFT